MGEKVHALRDRVREAVERLVQAGLDDPARPGPTPPATLWAAGQAAALRVLVRRAAADRLGARDGRMSFGAGENELSSGTGVEIMGAALRGGNELSPGTGVEEMEAALRGGDELSPGTGAEESWVNLGSGGFGDVSSGTCAVEPDRSRGEDVPDLLFGGGGAPAAELVRALTVGRAPGPEDIAAVHEALRAFEPAVAGEAMVRVRRGRLAGVVRAGEVGDATVVGAVPAGAFYLRPGGGRRASGAYYTPPALVEHLVGRALAPRLGGSPRALLGLRVIDPAMGCGAFLIAAMDLLGAALHAAVRRCGGAGLPGPAETPAQCRRLVAARCLYGIDSDPLAVALARASLWIRAHDRGEALRAAPAGLAARLVRGDALAGPLPGPRFAAVVGNPPWDKVRGEGRELARAGLPRGKERGGVGVVLAAPAELLAARRRQARALRASAWRGEVGGDPDLYHAFLERAAALADDDAALALLLPGGFAKNPADGAVRAGLARAGFHVRELLHFVNRARLFPGLPPALEFVAALLRRGAPEGAPRVAWNLRDLGALADDAAGERPDPARLQARVLASGRYVEAAGADGLAGLLARAGVALRSDLHRTSGEAALRPVGAVLPGVVDARDALVELAARGHLACYSGRSIAQHDAFPRGRAGKWAPEVDLVACAAHPRVAGRVGPLAHYRLALRATCGSPHTNRRSLVACVLPPGALATNSLWVEAAPQRRGAAAMLAMVALLNSFCVDHHARRHIVTNFGKRHMAWVPAPDLTAAAERPRLQFLARAALRLAAVNDAYAPLWRAQLGERWRERGPGFPALADADGRAAVRAAIDAAVADAYGLARGEYAALLADFRHDGDAPARWLAAFDELRAAGLAAFVRRHDPYWDVETA